MPISMMLSGKSTREKLSAGIPIEQTIEFKNLAKLEIPLERQDMQFGEK